MKYFSRILISVVSLAVLSVANAASIQMDFNSVITGNTPVGSAPWATLTITDTAANTVAFSLTNNMAPNGQKIGWLKLNTNPYPASGRSFTNLSSFVQKTKWDENKVNGIAGERYDMSVDFFTSDSKALKGGMTATWTASGLGLTASSFNALSTGSNGHFAELHIQSIPGGDSGKVTGNFVAAPVPEPATFAVLGVGALGLLRRKRK